MRKIYIPPPLPGVKLLPFLAPQDASDNRLFQEVPWQDYGTLFTAVADPEDAEFILVPHEYATLRNKPDYLATSLDLAHATEKPLILSAYQDDPKTIRIPGAIVLRASAYKSALDAQEILIPGYTEDIGRMHGFEPMARPEAVSVGFVGKAGFSSLRDVVRYYIRNYVLRRGPDREGMYFRRRALASLARHRDIQLDATSRKRFSGHRKTIEAAPEDIRERYIQSLKDSLFTLAPRGDGNFSLRFFETLSVGRIPVLIDTDAPLPLEDRIQYDECIIRIPWQDVDKTGAIVADFFNRSSDEDILMMQKKAREVFEEYLYMPVFLKHLFDRVLP